jgi:uncharacterized protein YcaQ
VYDLASRHIPAELLAAPDPNETEEAYQDWTVHRRIGSVGLLEARAGDAWLGIYGFKTRERRAAVARLVEQRRLVEVRVEGFDQPLYLRNQDLPTLDRVLGSDDPPPRAVFLAPIDNLMWDRRFLKELFDFHYRWEVYKPVAEREYGYYVLPVLYGDRFVARFEPVRDKESGALIVKGWWWEDGVSPSEQMCAELDRCFNRFLRYLGAEDLRVGTELVDSADLGWLVS